jgi:hypothetical protein
VLQVYWTSPGWQVGRRGLGNVFGKHSSHNSLSDAFALSRKVLVSFVISGRLSACNSVKPNGWISLRFDIGDITKICRKSRFVYNQAKISSTSLEDVGSCYFCRPHYIAINSLSWNEIVSGC